MINSESFEQMPHLKLLLYHIHGHEAFLEQYFSANIEESHIFKKENWYTVSDLLRKAHTTKIQAKSWQNWLKHGSINKNALMDRILTSAAFYMGKNWI